MKFWEAMKALQEGKKVKIKWNDNLVLYETAYLYAVDGIVYNSDNHIFEDLTYYVNNEFEIYEEKNELINKKDNMKLLIYDGGKIKKIKPDQIPEGSVISFFYINKIHYGVIYVDNFETCVSAGSYHLKINAVENIIIYDIPNHERIWMATDNSGTFLSYDKPLKFKKKYLCDFFINNLLFNDLDQKIEDKPWPVWIEYN